MPPMPFSDTPQRSADLQGAAEQGDLEFSLSLQNLPRNGDGVVMAGGGLRVVMEAMMTSWQLHKVLAPKPAPRRTAWPYLVGAEMSESFTKGSIDHLGASRVAEELGRMALRAEGAAAVLGLQGEGNSVDALRMEAAHLAVAALAERWALAADPDLSDEDRLRILQGEAPEERTEPGL